MMYAQAALDTGSPAHAGIDLLTAPTLLRMLWFPRPRGDRPPLHSGDFEFCPVPPPTRG